ncbi:hypotheical protein [Halarchaeum acidiphilum MH1-52-1]|uniref:Ribonuclease VapC n=1 Tax=Halarchaeum acidiphilum MH1-52-1 TaxID=1261545 RepID=U2YS27_9EURY|nr:PIN domain-containing protein [Halarchaeum acidiphilum]GAD51547.1 hypotheical protein [Halarchaeum acidiphilum MH1-52-1]
MRPFLDTNVFIATVADDPEHGPAAVELLDRDDELLTSVLNVMALRTVLTKKHRLDRARADEIETEIRSDVEVVIPDAEGVMNANDLQQRTLLYPMDCLILACAEGCDATLASFDSELIGNGATNPSALLDGE